MVLNITYQEVYWGKDEKGWDDCAETEPGPEEGGAVGTEPDNAPVEPLSHPAHLQWADLQALNEKKRI